MKNKIKELIGGYKTLPLPVKASVWYTFSNVLVKGISLLSTPIFTRVMSPSEYGTFALFQSWFNIIIIFTSLNIFMSGYIKGLLLYKENVDQYTSVSLFQVIVITMIFFASFCLFPNVWSKLLGMSNTLIIFMFIELVTMPAYSFWTAHARFEYRYRKVVIASIFTSVTSVLLGIVMVIASKDKVQARVVSDVLAKSVLAIPILIMLLWKGKKLFNWKYWKYNFKFNIPLIPHYLSHFALTQSDRVMIGRIINAAAAAQYSIAYTISMMMVLIVTAINDALTPYIYRSMDKRSLKGITQITTPVFYLIAFFSVITMVFAPEIIIIFAGKKYAPATYIVPPVSASVFFIFLYNMFSTIEYFYQKTVRIAFATVIAAALNIALNSVFIGKYGYYAAGYTTLVSYIVLSLTHYLFYRLILNDKFNSKVQIYSVKDIIISSSLVLLFMFIMLVSYKFLLLRYFVILLLLIGGIYKRKAIANTLKGIKKTKEE